MSEEKTRKKTRTVKKLKKSEPETSVREKFPRVVEHPADDLDKVKDYEYDELGRVWKSGKEILRLRLRSKK